mmetsp:Transcript_3089/g.7108  ORF Transcript_3089/g.7108 Transcript_3089/m.7108 type:complete len:209 (-) Transcript_3089:687-1313(-)
MSSTALWVGDSRSSSIWDESCSRSTSILHMRSIDTSSANLSRIASTLAPKQTFPSTEMWMPTCSTCFTPSASGNTISASTFTASSQAKSRKRIFVSPGLVTKDCLSGSLSTADVINPPAYLRPAPILFIRLFSWLGPTGSHSHSMTYTWERIIDSERSPLTWFTPLPLSHALSALSLIARSPLRRSQGRKGEVTYETSSVSLTPLGAS